MIFKDVLSSGFVREVSVSCLTFASYFMVGVCRGYTPFIISQLRETDSVIHLTQDEESWLATLTILPDILGCIIGGVLSEMIGRKYALTSIFIPFSLAWLTITFATNTSMLYIGTFFNGLASGMTFCTATYIAEICSPENRGFLLTILGPTFSTGILLCNITVYFLKWHLAAVVYLVLSVTWSLAFLLLLPESPVYLVGKDRKEQATHVLTWMRGVNNADDVNKEMADIENYCRSLKNQSGDLSVVLRNCLRSWKALLILLALSSIQQGSGYQIIVAYATIFIDALNIPFDSSLAVILYSLVVLMASFMVPSVSHRYGRKPLLSMSGLGMGIAMSATLAYELLFFDHQEEEKPAFWLVLLSIYGYALSLTLGVMLMPFVMVSELFAAEVRGIMCGIHGAVQYLITGIILKLFPWYLYTFGISVTLATFAVFSFSNILFAVFVLPETRGKTLNEIQEKYFRRKSPQINQISVRT